MKIDGLDAIHVGRAFLLAAPGVAMFLRERSCGMWEVVAIGTGREEEWLGGGGGTFEEAVGLANRIAQAVQARSRRPRRGRRHYAVQFR